MAAASMDSGPNTLLHQLMSNASTWTANTPSVLMGQFWSTNHTTYQITQQTITNTYYGVLVDSGVNEGMAGSDACVLSTVSLAHVDITGVGGSVLEHLPLVQCASLVKTIDEGPIVFIMSQYAYKPDTKTIHSKSQMEYFSCLVYDSALTAGRHQSIITHEGYVIPLHVCNGLCYIDLTLATDTVISTYANVFLTADAQWNPDIVDKEFFIDHSSAISNLPDIQQWCNTRNSCLDAFGDFNTLSTSSVPTTQACHAFVLDTLLMSPQQMNHCLPNIDILLPNSGWVGKDHIRDTLAKNSQHYEADQCVPIVETTLSQ